MIPQTVRFAVRNEDRNINLWLPLFPIWLLLLPIFALAGLVLIVFRLVSIGPGELPHTAKLLAATFTVLWKLNGLRVDIRSRKNRFVLRL